MTTSSTFVFFMRHALLFSLFLLGYSLTTTAQYSHQPILPTQSGSILLTNLRNNYRPTLTASYGQARDNMFKYVYEENDSITCVYTGLKRYLPPGTTAPRTIMLDNNSTQSINTEHTYPQSRVSGRTGRTDLHHMFPTRAAANSDRGSYPFDNIPSNRIDKWYLGTTVLTSPPPASTTPLYSKTENATRFEPRDDHKGNVARAMFYFYTMYKTEADAVDPNFFHQQKAVLCQWHLDDPVDSLEWLRTSRIASFQQQKVNPFVMDCTLPQRCGYCSSICTPPTVSMRSLEGFGATLSDPMPQPFSTQTTIQFSLERSQEATLSVYNSTGQLVRTLVQGKQAPGTYQVVLDGRDLASGLYVYTLHLHEDDYTGVFSRTLLLVR